VKSVDQKTSSSVTVLGVCCRFCVLAVIYYKDKMVLSTLLPLLLSRALTATALPTLGQIHHNATAIDLDKPQIIEIAAASDWPTFLNTVLTNKPTIARTLMNHTNFGNAMLADGLCAHERVCITGKHGECYDS
jgi:hypothetical protein